ncbi:LysR family transcriptional regulator [Bordetella sp. 15P40C-2]|uniref:LysR family transcriptional regulator n=1 Tax=Bordetella sp. 15P40C-2 TaxID=2572246 RepID=UPI00351AEB08
MNKLIDPPSLTRLEIAELETFLWVVREGSFSVAARKLHLSQPAVTNRVRRLEDKLHVKLLLRTTRRVEPTPDGILLRDAAEQAVAGLRDVLRKFQAVSDVDRNRVTVVVTPMLAATVMPALIHAYNERYPDVSIVLRDLPYEQVIRSVVEGNADMAVAALDSAPRGVGFKSLAEEKMTLVVPARHPLANAESVDLEQIFPYPLMLLDRYQALRKQLQAEFERRGAPFNPAITITLPTLLGMVDAGNCITFLPQSMAHDNARGVRKTIDVKDLTIMRCYGMVVARNAELNVAGQNFQDFLSKNFKTQLAKLA